MGKGNPWLYFSTTRWHLRGKSGQTRIGLEEDSTQPFLCEAETGKTTGKTRITGEIATNVYVSLDFFCCLFVHFENEQNLGLPHLNFQHHKLQLV